MTHLLVLLLLAQDKEIVSARVAEAPTIDGRADEAVWRDAPALEITVARPLPPDKGKSTQVVLKSVHTETHVYFLVRWKDDTKDDGDHKPWVWSAEKNAYAEGHEREDMFTLAFELSGEFDEDMLSGKEAVWDVWQWKASRTNPQGYAMDRTHRYSRAKPEGKAKSHKDRGGKEIWIARPEDSGETVEKKQAAPKEKGDAKVPQYLPGTPTGSAADVRTKGTWADGWWTLALERKLGTGHEDDTKFEAGRTYKMAVSAHDRTGDMDKASDTLKLRFQEKQRCIASEKLEDLEGERAELEESKARLKTELEAEESQEIAIDAHVKSLALFDAFIAEHADEPERVKSVITRFIDYVVWHAGQKGEGQLEVALFPQPGMLVPDTADFDSLNEGGRCFVPGYQMVGRAGFEPATPCV